MEGWTMQVKCVEMSPFPSITSIPTTRLVFNKHELATLRRAVDILKRAEAKADAQIQAQVGVPLGEYDDQLWRGFCGYELAELLEMHGDNGIQLGEE
jgi:hypothetical protein